MAQVFLGTRLARTRGCRPPHSRLMQSVAWMAVNHLIGVRILGLERKRAGYPLGGVSHDMRRFDSCPGLLVSCRRPSCGRGAGCNPVIERSSRFDSYRRHSPEFSDPAPALEEVGGSFGIRGVEGAAGRLATRFEPLGILSWVGVRLFHLPLVSSFGVDS